MQQSLFALPAEVKESVLWCRPCLGLVNQFAVGLRVPLPVGAAPWLRENCQVIATKGLPSGAVAVRVFVPAHLAEAFLSLPSVRGGSRHESNLLPW